MKKYNGFEKHFFSCQCHSPEHTLQFLFDEEENELSTSVFLGNEYMPWWKRLWIGIKYIFGYKCRYGHFDCFLLSPCDTDKFYALAKKVKDCSDAHQSKKD